MADETTTIQIVRGSAGGAVTRTGLSDHQRLGTACLVCAGTDNVSAQVGYVDGNPVRVHTHHIENWRSGETLPPSNT